MTEWDRDNGMVQWRPECVAWNLRQRVGAKKGGCMQRCGRCPTSGECPKANAIAVVSVCEAQRVRAQLA